MKLNKGKFIVIEGIDGAGTTSQSKLLHEEFKKKSIESILTFEPTDGEVGKLIRRFLQKDVVFDEHTVALLFAADRINHINSKILKNINTGKIVISDRYFLSSLAYQSVNVDTGFIEKINKYHIAPDITVLIDIDPEISLKRKNISNSKKADVYEKIDFQIKVRNNYLKFAEKYKEKHNVKIINGNEDIEVVTKNIISEVSKILT